MHSVMISDAWRLHNLRVDGGKFCKDIEKIWKHLRYRILWPIQRYYLYGCTVDALRARVALKNLRRWNTWKITSLDLVTIATSWPVSFMVVTWLHNHMLHMISAFTDPYTFVRSSRSHENVDYWRKWRETAILGGLPNSTPAALEKNRNIFWSRTMELRKEKRIRRLAWKLTTGSPFKCHLASIFENCTDNQSSKVNISKTVRARTNLRAY